jgi:sporulation protein YlmC with PRC-barrel domain
MKTLDDVQTWRGLKVVDADGDKIGTIEDIYLDRHTGEPAWATVKTGLFGLKSSFVPIRDAERTDEGEVRVPVQKEQVKDAPKIDAGEELLREDERKLYEYYGRSDYDEWQGEDRTTALDLPAERDRRLERDDTGDAEAGDAEPATTPVFVGVRLRRYIVITSDDEPTEDR